MIVAVLKLIIFTSMVNRIIKSNSTSLWQILTNVRCMHPSSHGKGSSHKGLNRWTVQATSVACTVHRFNPLWLFPLGLREGQSVCATTTREHTWYEEQNYRGCGDYHTWLAEQSMAGTGLSPRCVPCDEGCTHRTFVGMCHKLVELLFHFY